MFLTCFRRTRVGSRTVLSHSEVERSRPAALFGEGRTQRQFPLGEAWSADTSRFQGDAPVIFWILWDFFRAIASAVWTFHGVFFWSHRPPERRGRFFPDLLKWSDACLVHYPPTVFPPPAVHALDYKHVRSERDRILVTTHCSAMLTTHHKKERTQGPTRRPHFAPTHEALSSRNSSNIQPHTRRLLGSSQLQAHRPSSMHVRMHSWIRSRCGRIVSCMM